MNPTSTTTSSSSHTTYHGNSSSCASLRAGSSEEEKLQKGKHLVFPVLCHNLGDIICHRSQPLSHRYLAIQGLLTLSSHPQVSDHEISIITNVFLQAIEGHIFNSSTDYRISNSLLSIAEKFSLQTDTRCSILCGIESSLRLFKDSTETYNRIIACIRHCDRASKSIELLENFIIAVPSAHRSLALIVLSEIIDQPIEEKYIGQVISSLVHIVQNIRYDEMYDNCQKKIREKLLELARKPIQTSTILANSTEKAENEVKSLDERLTQLTI